MALTYAAGFDFNAPSAYGARHRAGGGPTTDRQETTMETFIIATITYAGPAYTRADAVRLRADYEAKGHKVEWVEGWREDRPFWALGIHCLPREQRPNVDWVARARASLAAVL